MWSKFAWKWNLYPILNKSSVTCDSNMFLNFIFHAFLADDTRNEIDWNWNWTIFAAFLAAHIDFGSVACEMQSYERHLRMRHFLRLVAIAIAVALPFNCIELSISLSHSRRAIVCLPARNRKRIRISFCCFCLYRSVWKRLYFDNFCYILVFF